MSKRPSTLSFRRRKFYRSPPGSVPGQLPASAREHRGQLRVIQYNEETICDDVAPSGKRIAKIKRLAAARDDRVTWIDLDGLGDTKLIGAIGEAFDLHPLALEDVTGDHQHAKLEAYDRTLFFVARMPCGNGGFDTEQISIFLIDHTVFTIQQRTGDCLDPVRKRLENALGRIRTRGADYLFYCIIDAILDGYFPLLDRLGERLERIGDDVETSTAHDVPVRLHAVRGELSAIGKILRQHRDAITRLQREAVGIVAPDTLLFFRDCLDHLNQLIEETATDRETCGELRELYFAMLGQRNNDVMKVLTIIATIFIPMSFVAGVYGMNFDSGVSGLNMPELHWSLGYPFALALMGGIAVGFTIFFYRRGWIGSMPSGRGLNSR